jgi:hypothetical protein
VVRKVVGYEPDELVADGGLPRLYLGSQGRMQMVEDLSRTRHQRAASLNPEGLSAPMGHHDVRRHDVDQTLLDYTLREVHLFAVPAGKRDLVELSHLSECLLGDIEAKTVSGWHHLLPDPHPPSDDSTHLGAAETGMPRVVLMRHGHAHGARMVGNCGHSSHVLRGIGHPSHPLEPQRPYFCVAVEQYGIALLHQRETAVDAAGEPEVLLVRDGTHSAPTRRALEELLDLGLGACVVDQDDVHIGRGVLEKCVQARCDCPHRVVNRHDDREAAGSTSKSIAQCLEIHVVGPDVGVVRHHALRIRTMARMRPTRWASL